MIDDRHAVVDGVPNGTRGGFGLCRSWGRTETFGAVRRTSRTLVLGTIRRERQLRGGWEGEHSLRHDAVLSVRRQPEAAMPMANRKERCNANQSCTSRGVGITAQALPEEGSTQRHGETLVFCRGCKDHDLVNQTSVVRQGPHQLLPLNQLSHEGDCRD